MGRNHINKNEFALKADAKMKYVDGSMKIDVEQLNDNNLTIVVTVKYVLDNPHVNLKVGKVDNDPIGADFDLCGILKKNKIGVNRTSVTDLTLVAQEDSDDVVLVSENEDPDVVTDGEKGNHGSQKAVADKERKY